MKASYPTVTLKSLVPDNCNFKDKTFESFVSHWMDTHMPGFPLGLLDTDSEKAYERWEIEPQQLHSIEKITWSGWVCSDCEEYCDAESEECCYEDDNETPSLVVQAQREGYAIKNDNTGERVSRDRDYIRHSGECHSDLEVDIEGEEIFIWDSQEEAEEVVLKCDACYDSEHGNENRYAFPWAHNWVFRPEDYVSTDNLKAAGFVVATYLGGKGDTFSSESFRLCGIDGGGYNFVGNHFAKIVAYHTEASEIPVKTDSGFVYITTDYRTLAEQITGDSLAV